MANYKIFSRTEKSRDISHRVNQDRFFCSEYCFMNDERVRVLSVADGMGGLQDGEKASQDAIYCFNKTLQEKFLEAYMHPERENFLISYQADKVQEIVLESIKEANRYVSKMADPYVETGTTLSVVVVLNGYAIVANIGDSPVYYYSAETEETQMVSKLHTRAEKDVERGVYERYTEFYYANDHRLYKSIGEKEEITNDDIFVKIIPNLQNGDMFILGSDGAFGRMREEEIEDIVKSNRGNLAVKYLFERAREDKNDDQTVILYQICEEVF